VYIAKVPPEAAGAELGELLATGEDRESDLPCRTDEADLWFAERPEQLGRAQALCQECPIRNQCLAGALVRREPWGVWGGEIFERGQVIPFKRGRGRPSKHAAERTVA
jgi:WhiB family transcriptional regulator, redox-sensing transcriptional regulator